MENNCVEKMETTVDQVTGFVSGGRGLLGVNEGALGKREGGEWLWGKGFWGFGGFMGLS